MITSFLNNYLLNGYFLSLLFVFLFLGSYTLYRIKLEFSEIEIKLLANKLELRDSLKEQIKGGIDYRLREIADERRVDKTIKRLNKRIKQKVINESKT